MSDISSHPVVHVHKPEYPSRCTGCEHLGWKDRDISSVTGSDLTEAERRDQAHAFGFREGYRQAQREAVDAFIRDELPGLLTKAIGDTIPNPDRLAARIAELRK